MMLGVLVAAALQSIAAAPVVVTVVFRDSEYIDMPVTPWFQS
jgi:hypothetical protein